ncbi:Linear gramicidin synthase subunit B [Streptomyces tendae]
MAELARVAAGRGAAVELEELAGGGIGFVPLLPVARYLLELGGGYDRFTMSSVVDLPAGIDRAGLVATLSAVWDRHDLLRSRLVEGGLEVGAPGSVDVAALVERVEADGLGCGLVRAGRRELDTATGLLDPAAGVMARFVWFDAPSGGRLVIVLHHLVVDGVSWRISCPNSPRPGSRSATTASRNCPRSAPPRACWAHALVEEASSPERVAELELWRSVVEGPDPLIGARPVDPAVDTISTVDYVWVRLPAAVTQALLTDVPAAFRGGVNDGLLSALALAVARWRRDRGVDESSLLVKLEGHGREEAVVPGADLSRTVGWFTSMFPVRLDIGGADVEEALAGGAAAGQVVKAVKEQLLRIPDKGMGHVLLRYLNEETAAVLAGHPTGQIAFNYLGQFSAGTDMPEELRGLGSTQTPGMNELIAVPDADMPVMSTLEINAAVTDTEDGPALAVRFGFPTGVLSREEVRELANLWGTALTGLARHAALPDAGGLTPSDVPLVDVRQGELERWEARFPSLTDVWPLTPLQHGLLFESMLADTSYDAYHVQVVYALSGAVEPERMRAAGQALLDRYANLRTAFVSNRAGELVQLVLDAVELPWHLADLRELDDAARAEALRRLLAEDEADHFDPARPPLLRITLALTGADEAQLVLTSHHALLDGWSLSILMGELLRLYGSGGYISVLPRAHRYGDFLRWLSSRTRRPPTGPGVPSWPGWRSRRWS